MLHVAVMSHVYAFCSNGAPAAAARVHSALLLLLLQACAPEGANDPAPPVAVEVLAARVLGLMHVAALLLILCAG